MILFTLSEAKLSRIGMNLVMIVSDDDLIKFGFPIQFFLTSQVKSKPCART